MDALLVRPNTRGSHLVEILTVGPVAIVNETTYAIWEGSRITAFNYYLIEEHFSKSNRSAVQAALALLKDSLLGAETFLLGVPGSSSRYTAAYKVERRENLLIVRNQYPVRKLSHAEDEAISPAYGTIPRDAEEQRFAEGELRMLEHLRIERKRSSRAADAKRKQVRNAHGGRLACEHCKTNWYAVYLAEIVEGIFEIHHTIPLAEMREEHETRIEDLLCLCANCHRAEHRRMANT